ncbi:MAG: hypothetical protein MPEBLZ_03720 [Candidatus Methanoperedens nitroreducens]|uniref:Uncharacterized protein n=1 Tax=Candidatus Methanoperedens nitratireducens TaxID=1392998 RepID=A0A0P8DW17_9EURY|nr:hypothetical protein [Candidatus Methanoperedens sp. BLZ2]KAB2947542.1 MAG: hypothetical protein F9K14_03810 [Candidatus Methanoperedens sp.]KPQ41755.1 MAG: hypothetical protein MPEBLZ_03720 [Candidatus Methanoperedens sp. BLZ1]MBZ0177553.1 hypothetical protein [Candidatus Methanoperedens nitroreducens]MCX9078036.1 hypothetical protein [Candidatus Methanoperedens sp.]
MITLDNILENIIAEIIVLILSFIAAIFLPKLIKKDKDEKPIVKYDPLSIAIFFELIIISNLILNLSFWKNSDLTVFLTLVLIVLGYLIIYIYNEQCPSCKKFIRAKKKIDDKIIRKFKRERKYQPMEITLYSNGNVWKKKPIGKEKTRTENWITKQEFYGCCYCGHKWDSGLLDVNLDEKTRPENKVIQTDKKDPNQFY